MPHNHVAKPADWVTITSPNKYHIFFPGEPQTLTLTGGPRTGSTYEVRNYYGTIVASGSAEGATVTLPSLPLGWYRVYIIRSTSVATYGTSQGVQMVQVWRDTAGMPPRPALGSPDSLASFRDAPDVRSAALMGPGRMNIGLGPAPEYDPQFGGGHEHLGTLETDGVIPESLTLEDIYLAYDTDRPKSLLTVFVNGTVGAGASVQTCVNALKDRVSHWEGRNEPEGGGGGGGLVATLAEIAEFHTAVKAADPTATILGPCVTSVQGTLGSGGIQFLLDFLDSGGLASIDALSFHDYNGVNGDLALGRKTHDRLRALLAVRGVADMEKWITEWGCFASVYGALQPRLQARWVMMEYQLLEQYGVPKEHFAYFYDETNGFWAFSSEVIVNNNGLYPAVTLTRVWSEELFGKNFAERYGFGSVEDRHYIGSRFEGADGSSVAAFSSAGRTDGEVHLSVVGATSLTVVSPWGVTSTLAVTDGQAVLLVDIGIPTYVRIPAGVTVRTAYREYGPDIARTATASASGGSSEASKVLNGDMSTWYFLTEQPNGYTGPTTPFFANAGAGHNTFPLWLEVDFGSSRTFDTVHVLCPPPWQSQGTLLDFDLQRWDGAAWVTIATVNEPTQVIPFVSPNDDAACTVESYFSDRCTFVFEFAPVTSTKIRLYARNATYGGGPTAAIDAAGGQTGFHDLCIREVEVYNRSALPAPKYVALGV